MVNPNQTAITEDAKLLESLMDNQSDLTELYNEPTYDELKDVLQNFLNPSDDTQASAPTTTTEKVAQQTTTKTTADVADAFDKLYKNKKKITKGRENKKEIQKHHLNNIQI